MLIALETELEIEAGATTRDKIFTLETVACIGACSIAPVTPELLPFDYCRSNIRKVVIVPQKLVNIVV